MRATCEHSRLGSTVFCTSPLRFPARTVPLHDSTMLVMLAKSKAKTFLMSVAANLETVFPASVGGLTTSRAATVIKENETERDLSSEEVDAETDTIYMKRRGRSCYKTHALQQLPQLHMKKVFVESAYKKSSLQKPSN
ncbi:uncharacterized protein MONOS_4423 [Monocercomonoides exilis]|uniref:uncharacterized protein n=1 Tax=Monocercomonoides exilis TaxID=2049356 RepID=UPI003559CC75|nr:hypothetical protein MONOS_4423 [Monocercomonoides exilis]|eukprot:MONOS_4423.1-p1 / transcript=MONOS_4423.1 / gene=MONOS_4423 / organism=Monocercomonoides_exilis_PA203 / gene_product=unspecified product / transcript_product=unspecified product / location=Mono_scaffold00117:100109-100522(-) / protein_length=138 / sequence_SO=supercontig / SO=protein_coding / is_pseudo=false